MKMDKVAGSVNDEFYTPAYAVEPLLKYVNPDSRVWCPFDTDDSIIVKELLSHGCAVTNTHLENGYDFFDTNVRCDVIISNPPYSLKAQVFESLFSRGKPFAMLVGVVGLFESQNRFNMFKNNKFEIMYLNKRVSYFKSYEDQKPSLNPPFSSVWVTSGLLPSQIVFEEINK
ncbi:hypothetical protein P0845_004283 [Salmonella enterica]|nr:hypothetical protein [Salmonella enterica]